ncbi:MAG TPA: 30S ribosomal protein S17 [Pyrinomonadaceae bacterium]|nr:30S ribosomal protein S17 [Pyrinomonadaceae bacterium]
MFRRKKKEEIVTPTPVAETTPKTVSSEEAASADVSSGATASEAAVVETTPVVAEPASATVIAETALAVESAPRAGGRGNRVQKVGIVASDKMQKTVVVRVDRLVMHMKYRRYVRRTSKFKAHDDLGSGVGDRVRIVETRPLSAQKRWRVVEILQKAAK